jgi:hypothetical protein
LLAAGAHRQAEQRQRNADAGADPASTYGARLAWGQVVTKTLRREN